MDIISDDQSHGKALTIDGDSEFIKTYFLTKTRRPERGSLVKNDVDKTDESTKDI